MLTVLTQSAIAILQDISAHSPFQTAGLPLKEEDTCRILHCLEQKKLIRLLPNCDAGVLTSYELCRPLCDETLLDVIEALDEPIRLTHPTSESYYLHYGLVAQKIGVLNHVARRFLTDIKISDW